MNKKGHLYIIRSMHRDCNYPQIPKHAHNLYKITNHPHT